MASVMETTERNRNALVGLVGLLVIALGFGWWWYANRDVREEPSHWIVFERQGGFAGYTDHLSLQEDGQASLGDDNSDEAIRYQVSTGLMSDVRDALDEVDWAEANAIHDVPPGADLIYYTIQHEGWFASGAGWTPEEDSLVPLIETLGSVIDSAPGRL
jgi:hypothetical protein